MKGFSEALSKHIGTLPKDENGETVITGEHIEDFLESIGRPLKKQK
jgi:hypothetical protein